MLWALATLQHQLQPRELLRDFSEEWTRQLLQPARRTDIGRSQHISNAAWSLARLRVRDTHMLLLQCPSSFGSDSSSCTNPAATNFLWLNTINCVVLLDLLAVLGSFYYTIGHCETFWGCR